MATTGSQNDPKYYASQFTDLTLVESRYLAFRDVPGLIKRYVKGNFALDYGCGSGQSPLFLKSLGFKVDGVDVNEHMISAAKNRDPSGDYNVIQSGEIPKPDDHYDFVYSSWVLLHARTKEELHKMSKDIGRVLKRGGTLIAIVNSEDTFKNEWLSAHTDFEENKNLYSGCVTKFAFKKDNFVIYASYYTEEDYREALEKAGLTVLQVHKPYGTDDDGYPWISEKDKAYVSIFVAQKLSEIKCLYETTQFKYVVV